MGIFTGKGMFCTLFALFVLCICWGAMNEGVIPDNKLLLIIVFALWELYVNAFYSAELKHKNNINSRLTTLKAGMDNATSQFTYNMYKNEYDSIKRSETARNIGKVIGTIGTLAATNALLDKYLDKEREKFDSFMERQKKRQEEFDKWNEERLKKYDEERIVIK